MLGVNFFRNIQPVSEAEINNVCYSVDPMLRPKLLAVGGGKGGVGKSFVASNLGILLSRLGKRVLLVDADLGAANLHTFFNAEGAKLPLSGFLSKEISNIEDVISRTAVPNLDIICGARDSLDVSDFGASKVARLRDSLSKTEYDYILLDTGPGTSPNLIDLFLIGEKGILVTTPEPTSVENTYRFLKCLVLRKIKKFMEAQDNGRIKDILLNAFNNSSDGRARTFRETFERIKILDQEEARNLLSIRDKISISMIVNQARTPEDRALGNLIKRVCLDYFGIDINFIGYVGYEECVWDSVKSRRPLAANYKDAASVRELQRCLQTMLEKQQVTI